MSKLKERLALNAKTANTNISNAIMKVFIESLQEEFKNSGLLDGWDDRDRDYFLQTTLRTEIEGYDLVEEVNAVIKEYTQTFIREEGPRLVEDSIAEE